VLLTIKCNNYIVTFKGFVLNHYLINKYLAKIENRKRNNNSDMFKINQWLKKEVSDIDIINYFNCKNDFSMEYYLSKVEDAFESIVECTCYGKFSENTREELLRKNIYGKVYFYKLPGYDEGYITETDLMDTLKSHIDRDKSLRDLYEEFNYKNSHLDSCLRIYRSFRSALDEYCKYYFKTFVIRYEMASKIIYEEINELVVRYPIDNSSKKVNIDNKRSYLYNTYNILEKKFAQIDNSTEEKVIELSNKIFGQVKTTQIDKLLNFLNQENLLSTTHNPNGLIFFPKLYVLLSDYYTLLYQFEQLLPLLKSYDDSIKLDLFSKKVNFNLWYSFYVKYAKDRYKKRHLYTVYYQYLVNTKGVSEILFKKIFSLPHLSMVTLDITTLPISTR